MNEFLKQLENTTNKEELKDKLTFYSVYLLIYERFKSSITDNIKVFLCDFCIENGEIKYLETPSYKELKNKKINGKSNIFINSLYWLKDLEALNEEDYNIIIRARNDRNKIGHELLEIVSNDLDEKIIENFAQFLNVVKKVEKWWINNIEIPISADEIPSDYDEDDVISGNMMLFDIIIETLYGKNYYKEILDKIKKDFEL